MKKHTLLRILCGLTFLIFLCPFFQMCSDERIENTPFRKENKIPEQTYTIDVRTVTDSIEQQGKIKFVQKTDTILIPEPNKIKSESEIRQKDKSLKESKKELTYNGYELVYLLIKESPLGHFDELAVYAYIFLALILLIAVIMVMFSFLNKYSSVKSLAIINLVLALLFIIILTFDGSLEEITQIKYGYYLFIINTFAITLLSKKLTNHEI